MPSQAQIQEAIKAYQAKGYKVSKLHEEYPSGNTSGTSVGMTGNPQSDYAKRVFKMPDNADPQMYPEALTDLQDVHDRLAFVTGLECGPTTMEARRRFGDSVVREAKEFQESGAKFSSETSKHLQKAHDGVARSLGMSCDSSASPQEKLQRMYNTHQETLQRMNAQHEKNMQELKHLVQQKQIRESRNYHPQGTHPARNFIREKVITTLQNEGEAILDRSRPLPFSEQEMERALQELTTVYLGIYDQVHGLTGNPAFIA